jgi:tetratricopeptide (TPR) repeat protein
VFTGAAALFVFLTIPELTFAQSLTHPNAGTSSARTIQAAAGAGAASPRENARQVFVQTLAAFILNRDHEKAKQGFVHSTEIDPSYAPAWFNLAVLSESEKNWSKAIGYFNEYLRLAPNGPDAERAKGEMRILAQYSDGNIDQAALKQAEYDATIQRARGFLSIGLFREAIAEAGRARPTMIRVGKHTRLSRFVWQNSTSGKRR